MNLKAPAAQLKTDLPAVFLALKDPDMPLSAKLLAALTVAYALSPIDLIPDCIPVFVTRNVDYKTLDSSLAQYDGKTATRIQIGKGAEHFIRTGRGRQITRQEAEEIIHRATPIC